MQWKSATFSEVLYVVWGESIVGQIFVKTLQEGQLRNCGVYTVYIEVQVYQTMPYTPSLCRPNEP